MFYLQKIGGIIAGAVLAVGSFFHPSTPPQSPILGATYQTADVVALFNTSLQSSISATANSFTLVSATYNNGANTLASSTYGMIIDEGTVQQEVVLADCTGTVCTNVQRGIDAYTGTTTVASLQFAHRRGASVKITDAPSLLFLINVVKGRQNIENTLTYVPGLSFSATSNQIPSASWVAGIASTASSTVDARVTALDAQNVKLTGTQSISGQKTFTSAQTFTAPPAVPYDTASSSAASVGYVNSISFVGSPNANTVTKGIVQIATITQTASSTGTGSTGAILVIPSSMATSTSQVATSSVVVTNQYGKIDSSFYGTSTFPSPVIFSTTITVTATSSLTIGSFPAYDIGKNDQMFTSSGAFVVPQGITKVHALVVSGGGGGGAASNGCSPACIGGPGGGGSYASGDIDVSATTSINVIVGAAGAGGTSNGNGLNGGTSSLSTFITAIGGGGGGGAASNGVLGNAGTGGTASGGDIDVPGGTGLAFAPSSGIFFQSGGASFAPINSAGPGTGGFGNSKANGSPGVAGFVFITW